MRDYEYEAHKAAEAHLAALGEALDLEEEGEPNVVWPDSAGPYDGCQTCEIRETLYAAWPIMQERAAAELRLTGEPV
jgi:hypothetical protein